MAEVCGKKITCDRCGKSIFLKCIGEGERDGGFTRWNKFEQRPEGWEKYEVPSLDTSSTHSEYMQVCPECSALWREVLRTQFLKESEDTE